MKKVLLIAISLILSATSFSQTKENPWAVGIQIGSAQYNGDIENQFFDFVDNNNGYGGFSVSRFLTDHIDIAADFTLGDLKLQLENEAGKKTRFNMNQANIHLKYNFFKYEEVKFRPFVFAGAGIIIFDGDNTEQTNLSLPAAGLGLNYKLNDHMNLRYQSTFLFSDADDLDSEVAGENDMFMQSSIALTAMIKATVDTDGDGVSDKKDQCPNTEPGAAVDANGCALDADGDGVPNTEDKCPDTPGFKFTNGCPDSDGDSIPNAEDPCPNVAGALGGCPDSDGDLVADKDDKCPNEAGLPENGGCPEEEEVADEPAEDTNTEEVADETTEPTDKVEPKETIVVEGVDPALLKTLNFQSESSTIKIKYYDQLTRLAMIMKKQADLNLEIIGYADSTGPDAYNMRLSEQRANRVKRYLVSKGISSSRINAIGKGEANPVASNDTEEGKAENRRVILKIKD